MPAIARGPRARRAPARLYAPSHRPLRRPGRRADISPRAGERGRPPRRRSRRAAARGRACGAKARAGRGGGVAAGGGANRPSPFSSDFKGLRRHSVFPSFHRVIASERRCARDDGLIANRALCLAPSPVPMGAISEASRINYGALHFWRESRLRRRSLFGLTRRVSKNSGDLFAKINPSVGAPDRRLHDVAGLQVFGPASLRG